MHAPRLLILSLLLAGAAAGISPALAGQAGQAHDEAGASPQLRLDHVPALQLEAPVR